MTMGLDEGPPLPDKGPVYVQVNGPAPPDTMIEIEPLASPLQVGLVTDGVAINTQGSITTGCPKIEVRPQASVTLQLMIHGVLVKTLGAVYVVTAEVGLPNEPPQVDDHSYVYGPEGTLAVTVAVMAG